MNSLKTITEPINSNLTRYSPVVELKRGIFAKASPGKGSIHSRREDDGPNKIFGTGIKLLQKKLYEWMFKGSKQ